jgi:predicted DNA-binding transcriptional regulator AlpA
MPTKLNHDIGDPRVADTRPLLSTADVADFLGVSASALNKWRLTGSGPRFIRLGSRIAYRPAEVDAFIESRSCRSTSEYGK